MQLPARWRAADLPFCGCQMSGPPRYCVRVTRRGPATAPYGWQICRESDSVEVMRSKETFPTRTEALADSVRAAAPLALDLSVVSDSGSDKEADID